MPLPPGPAAPEAPAPSHPAPSGKTSGLAIASLVLALVAAVPLSVILGVAALRRTRTGGQGGRDFAIAGLTISALWVVALALILLAGPGADRGPAGEVREAGSESVLELRVGDCLPTMEVGEEILTTDVIPCGQPHRGEVISMPRLPDGEWPGVAAVTRWAERRCVRSVDRRFPTDTSVEVSFFYPTKRSWEVLNDREVLCVAEFPTPRRGRS